LLWPLSSGSNTPNLPKNVFLEGTCVKKSGKRKNSIVETACVILSIAIGAHITGMLPTNPFESQHFAWYYPLSEPGPIPNGRIVVQHNCYKPGYLFAIKMTERGKFLRLKGNNWVLAHSRACRSEGALRYALDTDLKLSSEFIVDLLHGHKAQIQIRLQIDCPNGKSFLFHDNNGQVNGKQRVIAVAKNSPLLDLSWL
jgi:hypothetical protein